MSTAQRVSIRVILSLVGIALMVYGSGVGR